MSEIIKQLRLKGMIELGDKVIQYGGEWQLLKVGDTYIAQSSGGDAEILTVRRVEVQKRRIGTTEGKVFPKERNKKLFGLHEVVKVTIRDNPNPPKEKINERPARRVQHERPKPEVNKRPEPTSHGKPSVPNRPVPRDPGHGSRIDYRKPVLQGDGDNDASEPEVVDPGSGDGTPDPS